MEDDMPLTALVGSPKTVGDDDDEPLVSLSAAPKKVDDDAPLSAPKKVDDDAPLSALTAASSSASKSQTPKRMISTVSLATSAKRPRSGDSSSSSSSEYSSSDSDDVPLQKRPVVRPAPKRQLTRQQTTEEAFLDDGGPIKAKERSTKETLVAKLLCRWWYLDEYIKEDWPPQNEEYYTEQLEKNRLVKVTLDQWEWAAEIDDKGCRKVWELSQFRGLYRNSEHDLIDLRPKERCPSQINFMKKDTVVLCGMLINAYTNQLEDLANCRYPSESTSNELRSGITKTRNLMNELQSKQ